MLNGFRILYKKRAYIKKVSIIQKVMLSDLSDDNDIYRAELPVEYTDEANFTEDNTGEPELYIECIYDHPTYIEKPYGIEDRAVLIDALNLNLADTSQVTAFIKKHGMMRQFYLGDFEPLSMKNQVDNDMCTTADIKYMDFMKKILQIKSLNEMQKAISKKELQKAFHHALIIVATASSYILLDKYMDLRDTLYDLIDLLPKDENIASLSGYGLGRNFRLISFSDEIKLDFMTGQMKLGYDELEYIRSLKYGERIKLHEICTRLFTHVLSAETSKLSVKVEAQNGKINTLFITDDLMCLSCYQIASLSSGGVEIRKCAAPTCSRNFEVSVSNTIKKYCSPECGLLEAKRAERRRKKEGLKHGQH